jgi:hypothetical protein
LLPVTDSVDIEGKNFFWYKNLDEVVIHRLTLDIQQWTEFIFIQYDSINIVIGGDHGQRKFRMVIRLIYRNKSNPNIPEISHILKVGHINCIKDTRIVLEKTIGEKINNGCKALFGKNIIMNRAQGSASIHEEPPFINQVYDTNFISVKVNLFITGNLAFYATILGKEKHGWNLLPLVYAIKTAMVIGST